HVGIDLNAAIVEEPGKTLPERQRIADCFGELGLLADQRELGTEPWLKVVNDGPAPILAHGTPFLGTVTKDFLLDGVKTSNPLERLASDRRRPGRGQFVE